MAHEKTIPQNVLQAILQNIPVAIIVTGPAECDTPILYSNTEFSRLTGYSSEQVLQQNPRILHPDALSDDQKSERYKVACKIKTGKSAAAQMLNQRRDGSTYWAEFRARPLTNGDGQILAWVGAQIDVSDRIEAENEVAKLLSTFVDKEIDLLVHLLWKRSPNAARITERHTRLARAIGSHLCGIDEVSLVRAARLSMIGFLVLDDDVLPLVEKESELSEKQSVSLRDYPLKSAEIAMSLPQLEDETEAIQGHRIDRERVSANKNSNPSTQSALGQVLTMLAVLDTNVRRRFSLADAFDEMSRRCSDFDPSLVAEFRTTLPVLAESGWPERWESKAVPVTSIPIGSIAEKDIVDSAGRLLLKSGQLLTESLLQRLRAMAKEGLISPTIGVTVKS